MTLISFGIITKWSYGIAIDAKDVFFYGFHPGYCLEAAVRILLVDNC